MSLALAMLFPAVSHAQLNLTEQDNLTYSDRLSDIWGYVDSLGNEWAIVGVYNGVSIVDVTDPTDIKERHWISGPNSIWRDIKVWGHYAYVTNETSGGLLVIDLSNVMDTTATLTTYNRSIGGKMTSAHNIFIDENGIGYICGADYLKGGAIIVDCDSTPTDPTYLGVYNAEYCHDIFVRGDTLWTAEIYKGQFGVVDVSDKSAPSVMATQSTSLNFTHNIWLSDDGKYLFTTDEKSDAFIDAYDVSDLTDIKRIDMIQSSPGDNVIVHNTFYIDGWLVTSYYRDGVTVHDVHRPDIMVQTGFFDSSPFSGDGFNGCWGVYPYLPSGNILATDIEEGLFVLAPNYVRACYLQGTVTDTLTSLPIDGAKVKIVSPDSTDTDVFGEYAMGILDSGSYTVIVSRTGYVTKTITGVLLDNGVTTTLDVELVPLIPFTARGHVRDCVTGMPIAGAQVLLKTASDEYYTTTDASGNYFKDSLYVNTYDLYVAKWGYETKRSSSIYLTPADTLVDTICINEQYYDDFIFDLGWTETSTASSGDWVRDEPIGTTSGGGIYANPEDDVLSDNLDKCYMTGNGGGSVGTDDVDNGVVTLTTPSMDLTDYDEAVIEFYRWFDNSGGGTAEDDTFKIFITDGSTTVLMETIAEGDTENEWVFVQKRVKDYLPLSSNMKVIFQTSDLTDGHVVEAAIDRFLVWDSIVPLPRAMFDMDDDRGCAPLTVNFTDLSTNSPTEWDWDFGGGSPGTDTVANPTNTFTLPGTYTVELIATNMYGSDTFSMTVEVFENPSTTMSSTVSSGSDGTATATVTGGTAPYTYSWSTSDTTATITGLAPGSYYVTVTDANGCTSYDSVYVSDVNSGIEEGIQLIGRVFPNPFHHQINIEFTSIISENMVLEIFNTAGEIVHRELIPSGSSKISVHRELIPGLYLIKVGDETFNLVKTN